MRRNGRLGEAEGRRVAWRVLEAVAGLHVLGKYHGDVRVELLFADNGGEVFLGNGVGGGGLDGRKGEMVDAWGVGCVLFWLWTGFKAFGVGVGVGEEQVVFPEWMDEEKKRILGKLLDCDEGKRVSVLEIRKDRFWGAFRDHGLIESVSAMGSGSGDSEESSRRESGSQELDVIVTPKRARDTSTEGSYSEYGTTRTNEGATSLTPNSTTTSTTDFAVDGWDHSASNIPTDDSKVSLAPDAPRSPKSITPGGQPLHIRIKDPLKGFKVRDRRYRLKTYKNCFVGREAVTWLVEKGIAHDRTDAVYIGQDLLQSGAFRHVLTEHCFRDAYLFYTFEGTKRTGDVTEFRKSIVLNGNIQWRSGKTAQSPVELTERLLQMLVKLCLHHRFISSLGGSTSTDLDSSRAVRTSSSWRRLLGADESEAFEEFPFEPSENIDYVSLRKSTDFDEFELATAELRATDLTKVRSRQEKVAFAVNLYNLLALHARILQGAPLTRSDRVRFFRKTSYRVGLVHLSLDDLVHGLLRGNKRSPHTIGPGRQLSYSSRSEALVKKTLIVKPTMFEALCALNSTSPYDPPIRPVNEETVDDCLRETAAWFVKRWAQIEKRSLYKDSNGVGGTKPTTLALSTAVKPLASVLTARLPQIFDTYKSDFKNAVEVILWAQMISGVEELKDCKAVSYWGWNFGQCIASGDDGKIPMCPMFWSDTLQK